MNIKRGSVDSFMHDIKEKGHIYCFGAGKALTRFLAEFREYNIEHCMKAIVDNSINKQGTFMQCNSKSIPVISLEKMVNEITSKDVILIAVADFIGIIDQLSKIEALQNICCYLYAALRAEQYDTDRLKINIPARLSIYQEQRIPKIIHYCWFGKKEIPSLYRNWMESWKKYCPDYEIMEWNEKNYDVNKNNYIRQAYKAGIWAYVSDYARIDIVHEYGGVYLDTDVELVKNIDEMLKNDAFCGFENNRNVSYGLGYGAIKGHSLVGKIKEYYDNLDFALVDRQGNPITSPVIQTQIMEKHGLKRNGEFQIAAGMTVYPSRILCGMSQISFRVEKNPIAYAIHHFAASWVDDGSNQRRRDFITYMKKWSKNDDYFYPASQ